MNAPPTVSVVMAVYNTASYLPQAIESVRAQTLQSWELVAVDDGSTDGSREILAQFAQHDARIRVLTQTHGGLAQARNTALAAARGRYVAVVDSDDISLPRRLQWQVEYLDSHPRCGAVGGMLSMIDPDGEPISPIRVPRGHAAIEQQLLAGRGLALPDPAAMIRREALAAAGGYATAAANPLFADLRLAGVDHDLYLRLAESWQLANLPQTLVQYRKHAGSLTTLESETAALALRQAIVAQGLQRRGLPGDMRRVRRYWQPRTTAELHLTWLLLALRAGNVHTARKYASRLWREHEGSFSVRRLASFAARTLAQRSVAVFPFRRRVTS